MFPIDMCGANAGPSAQPDAVVELARAIDDYKRESGRMFPTWSEVLEIIRELGYAKPERLY